MLSTVRVTRGRYRGRTGTIPGTLEERAKAGITKALVRISGEFVLFATSTLQAQAQFSLPLDAAQTPKKPPPAFADGGPMRKQSVR